MSGILTLQHIRHHISKAVEIYGVMARTRVSQKCRQVSFNKHETLENASMLKFWVSTLFMQQNFPVIFRFPACSCWCIKMSARLLWNCYCRTLNEIYKDTQLSSPVKVIEIFMFTALYIANVRTCLPSAFAEILLKL